MFLELNFKSHNLISLVLLNHPLPRTLEDREDRINKKPIYFLDLKFDRNLETVLISGLDKILNKNKMSLSSLKIVKIVGEISKDSLSFQIAESFRKALSL